MAFTFSFTPAITMVLGLALMVSCQEVKLGAEEVKPEVVEETSNLVNGVEGSTRPPLTGIPQIDYIWDPNLPPALNGYNLSSYPFYYKMPGRDEMNFECDNRLDGFYASVLHKCQVYHQCLFGTRYDFMCANFTAFDQKIFNCQFANEVDCDNSPLFYDRNEALYKEASTTPAPTPAPQVVVVRTRFVDESGREVAPPRSQGGRFRRPQGKRRPVYYDDYYDYDYQEYYDAPANEEEDPALAGNGTTTANNKPAKTPQEEGAAEPVKPAKAGGGRPHHQQQNKPGSGQGNRLNIFNNNRPPPRIRPPVPNSESNKKQPIKTTTTTTTTALPVEEEFEYVDYVDGEIPLGEEVFATTTTTTTPPPPPRRRFRRPKMSTTSTTTTTTSAPFLEEEYVDDAVFEEEIIEPVTTPAPRPRRPNAALRATGTRPARSSTTSPTTTSTTTSTSAPVVEEEPIELPSKPNPSLFNRRTAVVNILKRRGGSTTTVPPQDIFNEYDEIVEEDLVDQSPAVSESTTTKTTTTTTTTPAPTRRTTKARPPRPIISSRPRATTEAPVVEEEAPVTSAPSADVVEPAAPVSEEAPTARPSVRGRLRSRPQTAAVVEEESVTTAAPVVRRGAQRRGPQPVSEVELDAQTDVIAAEENPRQGRELAQTPATSRIMLEESTNFDEDHGESQWSLIHLFSRVFPQRA